MLTHRVWLLAVDITVLGWLGHRIFRAAPLESSAPTGQGAVWAYVSMLSLAIVNPMTLLGFASWAAGLTAERAGADDHPLAALGIFLGSILWWVALTGATALMGSRLCLQRMSWVNRSCGAMVWTFALVLVWRALR